jgi:hypothetical protein
MPKFLTRTAKNVTRTAQIPTRTGKPVTWKPFKPKQMFPIFRKKDEYCIPVMPKYPQVAGIQMLYASVKRQNSML